MKEYTLEELSKHTQEGDCWVAIDGKVYDVSDWLHKHPGGADLLLLSSGRDVTHLFESYHAMCSEKPSQMLRKYEIGRVLSSEHPTYMTKSPFYDTAKQRVIKYFADKKIDPQNGWKIWARIASVYIGLVLCYCLTNMLSFNTIILPIIFAVLFGMFEGLFGLHILHDSCHAAVTHKPIVWKYMGNTFDLLIGASYFSWFHQHVLGHHVYTNVRGADPDVGEADPDFRRITHEQTWLWFHRYQHIYAPFLYGLLAIKFRLQDSGVFTTRLNGRIRVSNNEWFYLCMLFIGKVIFVVTRLILPFFFLSIFRVIMLFFISELVHGYYLAIVFQVNHIADDLEFLSTPLPPSAPTEITEDWAIQQVKTTQDYAHGGPLTFFYGALNYQVVHHLFPTVSQTYYPEIAPIVSQCCKEFGIKYVVLPSFLDAFRSHVSYLKRMGCPPKQA